ncbi:hypothetical protein D3C75_1131920 [compost metagenome]
MGLPVPLGPQLGVLQTEVGRQVNDPGPCGQQFTRQRMRDAMGRGEEHHVTGGEGLGVWHAEGQTVVMASQVRIHVCNRQTRFRTRSDCHHLCLRMLCQQTQQLDSGVTRAADDTDLDHNLPLSTNRLENHR